jgi:ADP-ribosylglycohydrolase
MVNGTPLDRAYCSLEGLSMGDAFGGEFFAHPREARDLIAQRTVLDGPRAYTDDTEMALSVVATLREHDGIEQDHLAALFAEHYDWYRGYGPAMHGLLDRIERGEHWRAAANSLFDGRGSFGNGAAMRAAPIGGYFADDLPSVVEQARRSAEVTHSHPEGIAGAIAVAVAAAWAWRLRDRDEPVAAAAFIELVLDHVPSGLVSEGLQYAYGLAPGTTVAEAASILGNGSDVTAQDTVPFTIWCAAQSLATYEEALWLAVGGMGDVDTTCAIVGGIVSLFTGVQGIPLAWRERREALPGWAFA